MIGLEYILDVFHTNANQLAKELGMSRYTIYDWLKGRRNIPKKRVKQLSEYFNLPEEYFQRELKESEKTLVQKAYIDKNATWITYEEEYVDNEGDAYTITREYSPEQELSEQLSRLSQIEGLIEEVKHLLYEESEKLSDDKKKLLMKLVRLLNSKDYRKIKMLEDVMNFLLYNDEEFGFMSMHDKAIEGKLVEIIKLYDK